MEVVFILVEPAVPENVGSAARAMKTMGFEKMRLVNPCDHLCLEARKLAHGSHDILQNAMVYAHFKDAIADVDFIVGTTAKRRSARHDFYEPHKIQEILVSKKDALQRVAIVFGCEESGLPNEILKQCDILTSIPLATTYPSLNLSQAIMLYAWELSALRLFENETTETRSYDSWNTLKKRIMTIFEDIHLSENQVLLGRITERLALIGNDDINLLHSVCKYYFEEKEKQQTEKK